MEDFLFITFLRHVDYEYRILVIFFDMLNLRDIHKLKSPRCVDNPAE